MDDNNNSPENNINGLPNPTNLKKYKTDTPEAYELILRCVKEKHELEQEMKRKDSDRGFFIIVLRLVLGFILSIGLIILIYFECDNAGSISSISFLKSLINILINKEKTNTQ